MPPKFDTDGYLAALKDQRIIDALSQALLPSIQAAVQTAVQAAMSELKLKTDEQGCEIAHLKTENVKLQERMSELEIYNRRDNIVIYGLDENYAEAATAAETENAENRNVSSEVQFLEFCKSKLNVEISAHDICVAHRLPRKHGSRASASRPLIVRFNNRRARATVMAAKRTLRQDTTSRVYINEHLTTVVSHLFAEARRLKSDHRIAQTWTFNGHVYVKVRDQTSSPVLVKSSEHLMSLLAT